MNTVFLIEISKKEKIACQSIWPLKEIFCCDELRIYILRKSIEGLVIGEYDATVLLSRLIDLLKKCLLDNLRLDLSVKDKLGFLDNKYDDYLWNEHSKLDKTFVEKPLENITYWIGEDYTLCGYRHRQTWLYNDDFGNIILEVTPSYYSLNKRRRNKISFEKWMKKYKPILKRTISKEIAQQWLLQMEDLLAIINQNIARMQKSDAQ
jgi:hypothetical protein